MLTPAWYLTNADFVADLPDAPRLDASFDVLSGIAELIGDDAGFSPAQTVTATHLALLAAVHLHDTARHAARLHTLTDLVRLLSGLNLLHAYLTQTIQQLAQHTTKRTFRGLADAPNSVLQAATDSLCAAGASGEIATGHLKQAHLALRQLTLAPHRREWELPFAIRQINDIEPGHQGPSCRDCADYQADRYRRAEQSPMLRGSDNQLCRSPHAGTYLFEARYSRWACTQGAHGPLDEFA
jgi:hypothetical protein